MVVGAWLVGPVGAGLVMVLTGGCVWGVPGAHADVCDLARGWVIWRGSGCPRGEGPGAKLGTA